MSTSLAIQPSPVTRAHLEVRNVVLGHGAWANSSFRSKVIPLLEAKHLHVAAVQLPLTSLADDVATTLRAHAQLATVCAALKPTNLGADENVGYADHP